MSQIITLPLSDELFDHAKKVASYTGQPVEQVLLQWLDRASEVFPIDGLPDAEVLALADLQMDNAQQAELSDLLARNRESELDTIGKTRLNELLNIYRRGMVRKAEAIKVAVDRGLRPSLS